MTIPEYTEVVETDNDHSRVSAITHQMPRETDILLKPIMTIQRFSAITHQMPREQTFSRNDLQGFTEVLEISHNYSSIVQRTNIGLHSLHEGLDPSKT
jgi:hypothetical protein